MQLTKQDVEKLAELSRLKLSEEESNRYQKTLGDILVHVDRLQGYMQGKTASIDRDAITDVADLRADVAGKPCTPEERDELLRSARLVRINWHSSSVKSNDSATWQLKISVGFSL